MAKVLYWIKKNEVLGSGKNCIKYGDEIDQKKLGDAAVAKLVAEKKIGQMKTNVVDDSDKEVISLKGEIAKLKDALKKAKTEGSSEKDDEIVKLKASITEKDDEIVKLKSDLEKATKK
jgi:hypothetical protein